MLEKLPFNKAEEHACYRYSPTTCYTSQISAHVGETCRQQQLVHFMPTRAFLVDDHPAVCKGLAVRISNAEDPEVCGEATDGSDAMEQLESTRPDVAVVDIQLKSGNGLDLVKRIRARDESVRVLVCSVYPDQLYAKLALNAGALGYVNREQIMTRVIEAIRRVREGKVFLCEEMAEELLS
jgi:DNA-binding NarL/FixJ family response regulator